jgi:Flp pilus assembly pilin Flp
VNITHKAWAKIISLLTPPEDETKEKGAGFVEYGALIVFVGIVAAVLMSSGVADLIVQGISRAVREALRL